MRGGAAIHGSAGKITNCQIGRVFRCLPFQCQVISAPCISKGIDDRDRLEAAYVPADARALGEPNQSSGTTMIARALAASVPFKWVAGDTVYGVGDIERQLRRAGKGYVLGVSSAHVFRSWGKRPPAAGKADDIARTRRSSDWKRLRVGLGQRATAT